jgi:hypothetical protein
MPFRIFKIHNTLDMVSKEKKTRAEKQIVLNDLKVLNTKGKVQRAGIHNDFTCSKLHPEPCKIRNAYCT